MSAITLEVAKKHLDAWLEAELAVTAGQGYRIGSRQLERANLYQIREQIKYWEGMVNTLERQSKRKGKNRVIRVIPRDF